MCVLVCQCVCVCVCTRVHVCVSEHAYPCHLSPWPEKEEAIHNGLSSALASLC